MVFSCYNTISVKKTIYPLSLLLVFIQGMILIPVSHAQPYGKGLYSENVPYGSETALSIATSGNVSIPITPTTSGVLATGTSIVTVTSTDVKGYKLYIRTLSSTDMNNLGALIPASSNGSPAALSTNTWGYNTNASSNFVGLTMADTLIHSITAPVSGGDATTVTYGVKVDLAKPAGNYTANIVYTAVPQTD
ncbi:MAG: hypothetical protein JWM00_616 [Candidatus Saccharibacteria bacterium]|nr:hypothetical protein [Candidatus Saccharibacteria bacterium]